MKKLLLALSGFAIGAAIVTSCDSKARLAENIQGIWSGNPEKILDTGAESASMTRMIEFSPDEVTTEGTITMTALITVENVIAASDSIIAPLTITASGTATITGTYQVTDNDDVSVILDGTSLSVAVDPDAVQLNYNVLTDESAPALENLKPAAAMLARQQISRAAQNAFFNISEIEDIHINKNIMKCEIGHHDLTFTKSMVQPVQ